MRIRKVLIVYKKSSYETHVLDEKDPNYLRLLREGNVATRKSKFIHREHRRSFETVRQAFRELKISCRVRLRYNLQPLKAYDLVVTIGGDGTFLETAHFLGEGILMGVNSAPTESVGFFCRTNRWNFREKVLALLSGKGRLQRLTRLKVELPDRQGVAYVLNDLLFASRNPAGTTRYLLAVGKRREEQKSSGVWVAPGPGSTAAIHSAGGRVLPLDSGRFQYVVREPYLSRGRRCRLPRGILGPHDALRFTSIMDDISVYIDGPHRRFPIRRGAVVTIRQANRPIFAVW